MEEKIRNIFDEISEDVELLRTCKTPEERIGAEIMALNAMVNAAKFIEKEKTTE